MDITEEYIQNITSIHTDEELLVKFKYILKYHSNIAIEINLRIYTKIFPLTYNLINSYYYCVAKQLYLLPFIKNWKIIYNNRKFWTLNITEQINSLLELKLVFMSLFDGTHSYLLIHNKLRLMTFSEYHVEEMLDRLTQVYKIFKFNFFNQINCTLLERDDFRCMSFNKQIDYMEYIFNRVYDVLTNYIDYFIEYNMYLEKLNNLL
jgi:hypothetical protein